MEIQLSRRLAPGEKALATLDLHSVRNSVNVLASDLLCLPALSASRIGEGTPKIIRIPRTQIDG